MSNRAKYKFVTARDIIITQGFIKGRSFRSEWLEIMEDGTVIIYHNKTGYAWDGCSPKFVFLDLLIGTPDGALTEKERLPVTWFASLVHDAIYQYKNRVPLSRFEADQLFLIMLREERFRLRGVYYFFIRLFGWLYGPWRVRRRRPLKSWDWFDWTILIAGLTALIDILTRIYLK